MLHGRDYAVIDTRPNWSYQLVTDWGPRGRPNDRAKYSDHTSLSAGETLSRAKYVDGELYLFEHLIRIERPTIVRCVGRNWVVFRGRRYLRHKTAFKRWSDMRRAPQVAANTVRTRGGP